MQGSDLNTYQYWILSLPTQYPTIAYQLPRHKHAINGWWLILIKALQTK